MASTKDRINGVFAYHALCTATQGVPAAHRGFAPITSIRESLESMSNTALNKGCKGAVIWNINGYEPDGSIPMSGVLRLRAGATTDSVLAKYARKNEWVAAWRAMDAKNFELIPYFGYVPPEWDKLDPARLLHEVQIAFWFVLDYVQKSGKQALIAIDHSERATPNSTAWLVRSMLSRYGIIAGCEHSAVVDSAWLTLSNDQAFAVITGNLWYHAVWSTLPDGSHNPSGWYPTDKNGNYVGPGAEIALTYTDLEMSKRAYKAGRVPAISLDQPWGAKEVMA